MMSKATFNNISVISWWSVLLVEYTEKTTDLSQVSDKLYHIILYRIHIYQVRGSAYLRDVRQFILDAFPVSTMSENSSVDK
jgi:hypothetical protein